MIPLYVVVEGPTEEVFVTQVLRPALARRDVFATPIVVKTGRAADGKPFAGGAVKWSKCRKDLSALLRDRRLALRVTTLFDLYGLPTGFPGVEAHAGVHDTVRRVELLEGALADDIGDPRFLPYLQRHEFEALVLASLGPLAEVLDPADRAGLTALRKEIGDTAPEDVNDHEHTAPSKRLARHIPTYQKTVHGPLAVEALGLPALRAACPRLDAWITKLESLADASGG